MPAIAPGSLVLVTGASGYIALLEAGFPVRGTVRSAAKGEYLANLFKDRAAPFEYVIVEDIAQPGAFDAAVKDVVGVAHTASPFHFNVTDPQQLIGPAVQGTLGVLQSIQKHHFTPADWNENSPREVENKGAASSPIDQYRASKTLAERAFWKFIADEKPAWDGATVLPSLVFGPLLQQVARKEELNTSVVYILDWFEGKKTQADIPAVAPYNGIDVRDGGERFITSNGPTSPNDWLLSFAKHFPERTSYAAGDPARPRGGANEYDGTKTTQMLGFEYTDLDTTAKDTIGSLIARLGV